MSEGKDLAPALEPIISRVRTDVTAAKTPEGRMLWTKEALTEVRVKRHLTGGVARGTCPIKAGESTTRLALFDLDSHKGQTPWEKMTRYAADIVEVLEGINCWPVVFRSSGGRGVHIFVVWDEPQDAYSVRERMKQVLGDCGLKDGAKGVAQGEVEVFPKQDSVSADGFGNQFILPLHGQSAPLEPLLDFEVMPREYALDLEWRASAPVPVLEKPVREVAVYDTETTPEALRELASALAFLKNDEDGLGYDEWRNVISGIHHETRGSDEGYALALAFSARSAKFEETELREKVWDWLTGKGYSDNPVTAATIYKMARDEGWQDVSAESFPVLPSPKPSAVAGEGHGDDELPMPNFKRDKNGAIEADTNNISKALARVDVCGMEIAFDEFKDEIVFCERGQPGHWQKFRNDHYFKLRKRLELIGFRAVGREMIRDAVQNQSADHTIDTAMRWLDGLAWDGKPRVEQFLTRYFSVSDSPYARAVSLYWWTAMAGRVYSPGCQADMSPILVSPQQGLRKSSAVASMVPEEMHRVMSFDQTATERARLMRGCLSAELAELHGLRTKGNEEIRAWMTRRFDEWTPKYQEFSVKVPRRCLFVGTSNPSELFEEYERRWLPITIGSKIDTDGIERDRDLLWAEAAALWTAGGVAWREAEELLKDEQGAYRVHDTWEEALNLWARGSGLAGVAPLEAGFTTREAMIECLAFSDKSVKRADEMRCANALKQLGFVQKVQKRDGRSVRVWVFLQPLQPLC